MDDIQFLLTETLSHFDKNYPEKDSLVINPDEFSFEWNEKHAEDGLPETAGLLYHIQKSTSLFVIRTFISSNIRQDYDQVIARPENYPSLRLVDSDSKDDISSKLRFFTVDNLCHAELIHEYVNNRRFPRFEENVCNLSDPGFSWWMVKKEKKFQVALTLSLSAEEGMIKLGPLGDHQVALKRMSEFESLLADVGLELNFQMETNRFVVEGAEDDLLMDDLRDLFEFGVIGDDLANLFRLLAIKLSGDPRLETTWFYFEELAAMRRFWIQTFYDLT
jgi:hypothetical protein